MRLAYPMIRRRINQACVDRLNGSGESEAESPYRSRALETDAKRESAEYQQKNTHTMADSS